MHDNIQITDENDSFEKVRTLRIAYLLDPRMEQGDPQFRFGSLKSIILHEAKSIDGLEINTSKKINSNYLQCHSAANDPIHENNVKQQVEVAIIMSSVLYNMALANNLDFDNIIPIIYNGDSENDLAVEQFLRTITVDFDPAIVIAYENYRTNLKEIFGNASVIHMIFGPFSRFPYPTCHIYDRKGIYANASILAIKDNVANTTANEEGINFINVFRNKILQILARYSPYKRYIQDLRARFSNIVLFASQLDNHTSFTKCSYFDSHYQALDQLLGELPADMCMLVTCHPYRQTFSCKQKQELQSKFNNVIFLEDEMVVTDASQLILPYCDGIVTASSGLGYQASLFSMPMFLLGQSHLSAFSVSKSLQQFLHSIRHGLTSDEKACNVSILLHLLTSQTRLFRHSLGHPEQYMEFLIDMACDESASVVSKEEPGDAVTRGNAIPYDYIYQSINERSVRLAKEKWQLPELHPCGDPLLQVVAEHDVISFDLFDTLIQRPLAKPHMLFKLLNPAARRITGNFKFDFWKVRRDAEADVRRPTGGTYEISITQIYDRLQEITGVSNDTRDTLLDLELEAELQVCQRRASVLYYMVLARRLDKRVGVISDFYIEQPFIKKLLAKLEIQHEFLYVSATEGSRKHNGTMFPLLVNWAAHNGYEKSQIVHIGDNRIADLDMARANGVDAFWLPRAIDNFGSSRIGIEAFRRAHGTDSISDSVVTGLVANRLFSGPFHHRLTDRLVPSNHEALGYAMYGPLIFGFTKWLRRKCREKGVKRVYFLSRDGYILKNAFDIIAGDEFETCYLLASRKTYAVAAVKTIDDLIALVSFSFNSQKFSDFIQNRIGVNVNDRRYRWKAVSGLSPRTVVSYPSHLGKISEWLKANESRLIKHCKRERSRLLGYLETVGLSPRVSEQPVIVDLGYSGTMQLMLSRLLDVQCFGAYFLSHQLVADVFESGNVAAYRTEFDDHFSRFRDVFNDHVFLFEAAFSAPHPTVNSFVARESEYPCTFGDPGVEKNNCEFLMKTQKGMIEFIKDAKNAFGNYLEDIYISSRLSSASLVHLAVNPTKADAGLFFGNGVENNFGGGSVFLIHPAEEKISFEQQRAILVERSKWKPGAEVFYASTEVPVEASHSSKQSHSNAVKQIRRIENLRGMARISVRDRKIGKMKQDPFRFFLDSKSKCLRTIRYLFAKNALGRLNAHLLRKTLFLLRY